ncbi:MAG: isoaspartyl peptidase/L-asparaginase family protein, partial [Flavobacteriales bacterium]
MNEHFALVIHGGAGTILKKNMTQEKEKQYEEKLLDALNAGYDILKNGGSSVECVEAVIRVMEDSPLFNAGKGSVFTSAGKNEMDASIMEGSTLNAGSVAGVTRVKNPISAARKVMEESPHVMLAGRGADAFAKNQGLEMAEPSYFYNEIRHRQWLKVKEAESEDGGYNQPDSSEIEFNINIEDDKQYGTVGAVALDRFGDIAAGTSTGGMTNKRWGRVGDSPIIAAGTYADNKTCGVSCTGHGEYFIRAAVAYDVSARMKYMHVGVKEAAFQIIHGTLEEIGGKGGLIALDAQGNLAMEFNTSGMYRGFV